MSLFEPGQPIYETEHCIIRQQKGDRISIEVGDEGVTGISQTGLFYALRDSLEGSK